VIQLESSPYHGDSYEGHEIHIAAVGCKGLRIGDYIAGRITSWRIDGNGIAIG
jgi:hypothetical protein